MAEFLPSIYGVLDLTLACTSPETDSSMYELLGLTVVYKVLGSMKEIHNMEKKKVYQSIFRAFYNISFRVFYNIKTKAMRPPSQCS